MTLATPTHACYSYLSCAVAMEQAEMVEVEMAVVRVSLSWCCS